MIRYDNGKPTNKSAASKMWVEMWMKQILHSEYLFNIDAEQTKDGKWLCEFELPVINKEFSCLSSSHVDAVKNACDEAAKAINEYMDKHPEIKIHNIFHEDDWVYDEDLTTNEISVSKSLKARKEGWGWGIGY